MVLYVATDCIHLLLVTVACHTYTHKMSNLVIPHLLTRIFKVCNPHLVTYTFTNNWWPQIVTTALTNNWRWMCDQSYLWLLFTILNIFIKYIFTNIFITYTFTNSWWPQPNSTLVPVCVDRVINELIKNKNGRWKSFIGLDIIVN